MPPSFLLRYLDAFHTIEGWFSFDAALLFMAYNSILARSAPRGDTLEIGVHHGLSSIAIAALRGDACRFVAVDLFEELQHKNVSRSGEGNRAIFLESLRGFFPDIDFVKVLARASTEIAPRSLGANFTFCHIDGGHSHAETFTDISLCNEISSPSALIAIDDYFNPEYPGVCEGTADFMLRNEGALSPVAIGFGKVVFQKAPRTDLAGGLKRMLPNLSPRTVTMWGHETALFDRPFRQFVDLQASTPGNLIPFGAVGNRAGIHPQVSMIRAASGQTVAIPVLITNSSTEGLPAGEKAFGLSYHLLSASGRELIHDNDRVWIAESIPPGAQRLIHMPVQAPSESGPYRIEIDLVWEGITWFKELGNSTACVKLSVD